MRSWLPLLAVLQPTASHIEFYVWQQNHSRLCFFFFTLLTAFGLLYSCTGSAVYCGIINAISNYQLSILFQWLSFFLLTFVAHPHDMLFERVFFPFISSCCLLSTDGTQPSLNFYPWFCYQSTGSLAMCHFMIIDTSMSIAENHIMSISSGVLYRFWYASIQSLFSIWRSPLRATYNFLLVLKGWKLLWSLSFSTLVFISCWWLRNNSLV